MLRSFKLHAYTAALLGLCALSSKDALGMTLLEAYQAALLNDATYQSALHEKESGLQNRQLGLSGLLPVVSASHSTTKNRADITAPDAFGVPVQSERAYASTQSVLQLRQPLLNLEATARYRQGIAQADYSESAFAAAGIDLLLRVAGAYFDARLAEDRLMLISAQRDTLAEQVRMNERMFKSGEGTRTDVLETQARHDLAHAQLIEAQDLARTASAALAAVVGGEVGALWRLRDGFVAPLAVGSLEEWTSRALEHNPEIAAMRQAVTVALEEVNRRRARHAPRVDAIAGLSRTSSEIVAALGQTATVRTIGIQLSIPIYSGGATAASESQGRSQYEKAKSDLEAKTRQVLLEVRKQYGVAVSSAARIEALMKSIESARLALTATQHSIRGGVRINLDLLLAQQQLHAAQVELTTARHANLISHLRLRGAAGSLSVDDLRVVAAQFSAQ